MRHRLDKLACLRIVFNRELPRLPLPDAILHLCAFDQTQLEELLKVSMDLGVALSAEFRNLLRGNGLHCQDRREQADLLHPCSPGFVWERLLKNLLHEMSQERLKRWRYHIRPSSMVPSSE